jgi:hypothetical protein
MYYGAKLPDMYRRAATHDRVTFDVRDRPPRRPLRTCVVLLVTLVSVALLTGGLINAWGPTATSAQEIEVDLVGFLVLAAGERLPPSGEATARLEVPNDQGGARLIFPVEFTRRTEMALPGGTARSGQLVRVEGVIHQGRVRILRLRDVQVIEYGARMSLPGGPLALPVADDRIVEVVLEGPSTLAVTVLLTPRTASRRAVLLDGQPVILTAVNASKVVVKIEGRD